MAEAVERFLEHKAYDDPSTYKEYQKQKSEKGIITFQSDQGTEIDRLEKLVGEDRVDEAAEELQSMYERTVKGIEKRIGRKIALTEADSYAR